MAKSGLDFLLVYPEGGFSMQLLSGLLPPLGVIQIASFLNFHGFKCRVIDTRLHSFTPEWFADYIHSTKPRFIGFCIYTDSVYTTRRLIAIARKASPSSRIIAGGSHPTVCDDEVLEVLGVDIVVRGEGEMPCLNLLQKKRLPDIKGISYRRGKKIIRNSLPSPIDLDILPPPDYEVVEKRATIKYIPALVTGRGCPYRCSFCAAGVLSPRVHWRSIDKVIEDIVFIRNEFIKNESFCSLISILDDTFTLDGARTEEFCRKVKKIGGGTDFLWYAEGRVDRLGRNPKLLKKMREAGLIYLQVGVESADENVLKAYRKEIKLEDVVSLCKICADEGIFIHTGFIMGGAFESKETIEKTRKFAHSLIETAKGFLQVGLFYLNPLPGTDMYIHPEKYGIKILDPCLYSSFFFDNCVTETEHISREEIIRQKNKIWRELTISINQTVKRQGEKFHKYCSEIIRRASAFHLSLVLLLSKTDDIFSLMRTIWPTLKNKAKTIPQFVFESAGKWKDLVPARTPFVNVDENGNYMCPMISDEPLSHSESEVFHFCSGKLTGREIAKLLGKKQSELADVFASLENKGYIIYRTY